MIKRTLLAMKIAPVSAAMREPGASTAAAIGIRNHRAKARMKRPMPHLNRHPAAGVASGCVSGVFMAGSFSGVRLEGG
ncbi:hypothetical protein D3C72_2497960 [compost metagenome]